MSKQGCLIALLLHVAVRGGDHARGFLGGTPLPHPSQPASPVESVMQDIGASHPYMMLLHRFPHDVPLDYGIVPGLELALAAAALLPTIISQHST